MRKIIISLFLLATIFAQAQTTEHVVKRGETYASIANKYGISEDALLKANPKAKKGMPFASQKLIIPKAAKTEKVEKVEKVVSPVVEAPSKKDESKTSKLVAEAKKEKPIKAETKKEKPVKAESSKEAKQQEKEAKQQEKNAKQQEKEAKAKQKEEAKLKEKEAKQQEKEANQKEKEKEAKKKKLPRPEYSPYYEVAPDDPEIAFVKHIVKPDETLFTIYHQYGLKYKYKMFCRYNRTRYIEPGQLLLIPCDLSTAQNYKSNSAKAMRTFNSYTDAEKERYTKSGNWVGAMAKVATEVAEGVAEVKTGISNIKEIWHPQRGMAEEGVASMDGASPSVSKEGWVKMDFNKYTGRYSVITMITPEEVAQLPEDQRLALEKALQDALLDLSHDVWHMDDEIRDARTKQRSAAAAAAGNKFNHKLGAAKENKKKASSAASHASMTRNNRSKAWAKGDLIKQNLFTVQNRVWTEANSFEAQHEKSARRIAHAQQEIKHSHEMHDSLERQYNQQASIVDKMDKGLLDFDEQSYKEAKEKMRELREQNNSNYDQKIEESNLEK